MLRSTLRNLIEIETTKGFAAPGILLPLPKAAHEFSDRKAVYGIRPEHFVLDDNGVPAEIALVEPMGSETQVTMKLGETQVTGVFRERVSLSTRATIRVCPELANIHLFASGGQRLRFRPIPRPKISRQRSEVRSCRTYADHTIFAKAALSSMASAGEPGSWPCLRAVSAAWRPAGCGLSSAKKVRAAGPTSRSPNAGPSASLERNG